MDKNVVVVGHDLKSCTAKLEPVYWPISEPANVRGRRLVLIDTPGFDDTYTSDSEILRRIAVTLASSCVNRSSRFGDQITLTRKDMILK